MKRMRRTKTSKVWDVLRPQSKDSWLTTRQLSKMTGLNATDVAGVLYHLRLEGSIKTDKTPGKKHRHQRIVDTRPVAGRQGYVKRKAARRKASRTRIAKAQANVTQTPLARAVSILLQEIAKVEDESRQLKKELYNMRAAIRTAVGGS